MRYRFDEPMVQPAPQASQISVSDVVAMVLVLVGLMAVAVRTVLQ